ncbi:MAG: hypothetical protein KDK55_03620 [Chlamydiia bacterium]|nr:hypothetical protein [Chlamydiia bacterium]
MQQIEEARRELTSLVGKGQSVTTEEIREFFERYGSVASDMEAMRKEKMLSDIALLLTLAEQRELSL